MPQNILSMKIMVAPPQPSQFEKGGWVVLKVRGSTQALRLEPKWPVGHLQLRLYSICLFSQSPSETPTGCLFAGRAQPLTNCACEQPVVRRPQLFRVCGVVGDVFFQTVAERWHWTLWFGAIQCPDQHRESETPLQPLGPCAAQRNTSFSPLLLIVIAG